MQIQHARGKAQHQACWASVFQAKLKMIELWKFTHPVLPTGLPTGPSAHTCRSQIPVSLNQSRPILIPPLPPNTMPMDRGPNLGELTDLDEHLIHEQLHVSASLIAASILLPTAAVMNL